MPTNAVPAKIHTAVEAICDMPMYITLAIMPKSPPKSMRTPRNVFRKEFFMICSIQLDILNSAHDSSAMNRFMSAAVKKSHPYLLIAATSLKIMRDSKRR